ncbi:MAG: hypothetical protein IPN53_25680 [Comamonadaceae bacterium]|nr:hypothetical protein [Comamonadaceae bacterium]
MHDLLLHAAPLERLWYTAGRRHPPHGQLARTLRHQLGNARLSELLHGSPAANRLPVLSRRVANRPCAFATRTV